MRLRCPFLLLLSSLVPLRLLGSDFENPADTTVMLQEVSVSAMKAGQLIGADPVAATVLTRQDVNRLGLINIKQVSDIAPNFYMPVYGSRITSSIYVRGLGSRIDKPVISLNFDNIPILHKNNFDFDTNNLGQIEMVRGAESTLYGLNSMMGVLNLYSLSPLNFQGFKATVSYGSYNYWKASAGYYTLNNRQFGIGFELSAGGTDGYWKNNYNGCSTGKELWGSARLRLTWTSPSKWKIDNSLTLNLNRQSGYPYESLDNGVIAYNDTCFYKRVGVLEGLTVQGQAGKNVTLTSVTSLQYLNDNMTLDQDFLPQDYFTLTQAIDNIGLTEELTLKNSHAIGCYDWLAGAFVWYENGTMHAPVTFYDYGIKELIEQHWNDNMPQYPLVWDERSFLIDTNFKPQTFGWAVYHESKVNLGRWKFTGGIRLEYVADRLYYNSIINSSFTLYSKGQPFLHEKVNIADAGTLKKTGMQLLPKITAMYRYGQSATENVYLNICKGYKSGGYNTQMFSDVMQQRLRDRLGMSMQYDIDDIVAYEPETAWNFELGFHSRFAQGNLNLSGNLFYIDCRNQQVTMFPSGSTTGRIMANAGRSRSVGGELSGSYRIDSHWTVAASVGVADARFITFNDGINSYDGKHVPLAPLTTSFLMVDYSLDTARNGWWLDNIGITLSAKGTGPIWWDEENNLRQNWYPIMNANVRLSKKWLEVELWMENIANTRYSTFYFQSIGHRFTQRGLPFCAGATLRFNI